MWKTALKLLVVMFLRNRMNVVKSEFSSQLHSVKENFATMAESRAAIFKQNFNDDLQRMVNSFFGYLFIMVALACSGLTGVLWLVASAWNSPHRDLILGTAMILPILLAVCAFSYLRFSWKKEPLLGKTIKQIEADWLVFRAGLDGTADISDEANK